MLNLGIFKRATPLFVACVSLPCSVLLGCGGGGGGGGAAVGDRGNDSSYGVRVFHAAIDAAPVDVNSSSRSGTVVSQQFFAGDMGYRSISSGPQVLSLTRAFNPGDVLASFSVNASSTARYSVLLYGDLQSSGLRTRLIEDSVPLDLSGAAIRVVHGIVGATALNVAISSGSSVVVGLGQNSDYVQVEPGDVKVEGFSAADGTAVGTLTVSTEAGRAYTVLFAGEAGFYSKPVSFVDR
jgi:hypothetical protein